MAVLYNEERSYYCSTGLLSTTEIEMDVCMSMCIVGVSMLLLSVALIENTMGKLKSIVGEVEALSACCSPFFVASGITELFAFDVIASSA